MVRSEDTSEIVAISFMLAVLLNGYKHTILAPCAGIFLPFNSLPVHRYMFSCTYRVSYLQHCLTQANQFLCVYFCWGKLHKMHPHPYIYIPFIICIYSQCIDFILLQHPKLQFTSFKCSTDNAFRSKGTYHKF